ncbi:MAG: hypothetical protein ABIA37_03615 [Candidatus Woesearchaeota archaeon]
MAEIKEHPLKKWEVSIMEVRDNGKTLFKVTEILCKRLPPLNVGLIRRLPKKYNFWDTKKPEAF